MGWLIFKYATTAFLVVVISEVAKRSDRLGSFIAALPTITVLTWLWLYFEKQPDDKITNHALYTFWYVVATLPMFLLFPWMRAKFGFWGAVTGLNQTTVPTTSIDTCRASTVLVKFWPWPDKYPAHAISEPRSEHGQYGC